MQNKSLGRMAMSQSENLDRLAPEQYEIWKSKAAEIQTLNTRFLMI